MKIKNNVKCIGSNFQRIVSCISYQIKQFDHTCSVCRNNTSTSLKLVICKQTHMHGHALKLQWNGTLNTLWTNCTYLHV